MSVTVPVGGVSQAARSVPVASLTSSLVGGATGTPAAACPAPAGPADTVSFSRPAADWLERDAPVLAMRQLDSLLREFEQIAQLTRRAVPGVLGELAAEIGATASALGNRMQALAPGHDAVAVQIPVASPTPLPGVVPPVAGPAAEPDGRPGVKAAGGRTAATEPERAGHGDAPVLSPSQMRADASAILQEAGDTLDRMRLRLQGAPGRGAEPGSGGSDEQNVIGVVENRWTPAAGIDAAWCAMQIAQARTQVSQARDHVDGLDPSRTRSRNATGSPERWTGMCARRAGRLARSWKRLLPIIGLAGVAAAAWMTSGWDLRAERLAAGIIAVAWGLGWSWRRAMGWYRGWTASRRRTPG